MAVKKYKTAGIQVLTVPQPGPYDQVVQAIIVTKLNAILEDTLVITDSEISSVAGGFVTYMWSSEDTDDEIHDLVNDEVDEMWWAAPEPRFVSLPVPDEDDEEEVAAPKPEQLVTMAWDKLDLQWYDEATESEPEVEIVSPPDATLTLPQNAAGLDTVIKMSDFKDNK